METRPRKDKFGLPSTTFDAQQQYRDKLPDATFVNVNDAALEAVKKASALFEVTPAALPKGTELRAFEHKIAEAKKAKAEPSATELKKENVDEDSDDEDVATDTLSTHELVIQNGRVKKNVVTFKIQGKDDNGQSAVVSFNLKTGVGRFLSGAKLSDFTRGLFGKDGKPLKGVAVEAHNGEEESRVTTFHRPPSPTGKA
jgi:hypothetical protein